MTVEGEGRIALNAVPSLNGPYVLDAEDVRRAEKQTKPGKMGYEKHNDTCPVLVRERER